MGNGGSLSFGGHGVKCKPGGIILFYSMPPLVQADRRGEAFTDVHVNLVGAAAEAFIMGDPLSEGTKVAVPGGASTPIVVANGANGGVGECWGENDERALLEALKKCGKDLGPQRYVGLHACVWDPIKHVLVLGHLSDGIYLLGPQASLFTLAPDFGQTGVRPIVSLGNAACCIFCGVLFLRLQFPVSRWDCVSELVPGKSKAQCFKRFKELRDAHRSRKGFKGAIDADD